MRFGRNCRSLQELKPQLWIRRPANLNGFHFTRLKAAEALFGSGGAKGCVKARLESGVNDLAIFTFDVPQFHERSATVDGLQLIKGEFGAGHWFEGVVEVFPSDAHTISGFSR